MVEEGLDSDVDSDVVKALPAEEALSSLTLLLNGTEEERVCGFL